MPRQISFMKLLHYGKPIIVCKNTSIDQIVEEEKVGISIDYSAEEFVNAIKSLDIEDYKNSTQLYKKKYSWDIMEQRLKNIFKEEL